MMYKEKQDKTKQNLAAASDTRMTTNATAAAAGETTKRGLQRQGTWERTTGSRTARRTTRRRTSRRGMRRRTRHRHRG